MEYEDQRCLRFFLLELKRHKEKLLKDYNTATQAHLQRTITTFFSPITPNATSQTRDTQMGSDQDITKVLQLIEHKQFIVHVGPRPMDHDLNILVIDR